MSTLAEVAARELNLGLLRPARPGRGGDRRPGQAVDPRRHARGGNRRDVHRLRARRGSGLVHRLFDPVIERSALLGAGLDWKTSLQELTADRGLGVPEYHVKDSGPDHQKMFRAVVKVGARELGEGEGRSKKAAEQLAAEAAYRSITADAPPEKAEVRPKTQDWQSGTGRRRTSDPLHWTVRRRATGLSPAAARLSRRCRCRAARGRDRPARAWNSTWSGGRSPRPRCSTRARSAATPPARPGSRPR